MDLKRAIEGWYLFFITSGNSKSTADLYRIYLDRFCEFWGNAEIEKITEQNILQFYAYMQTDYIPRRQSGNPVPLKQSSVMKIRNALVSLFTWAKDQRLTDSSLIDRLKTFKVSDQEEVLPFEVDEIKALVRAAESTTVPASENHRAYTMKRRTGKRDVAIIYTLLDTGLRISEMCRLLVKDVDLKTGAVDVARFGTGRKTHGRLVYIEDVTKRAIWSYLATRGKPGPNEPLFVSQFRSGITRGAVQSMLYDLGDKAGVHDVHPHRFRHTFAVYYLRNGGDPFTLQRILGHATLAQVNAYMVLAQSDMATAHRRASPVDNLNR